MLQARQNINYIRNSVKATVDAYDGTVTLYEFDESDPVLQAWNKAFGGNMVKPKQRDPAGAGGALPLPARTCSRCSGTCWPSSTSATPASSTPAQDFWQVPDDPTDRTASAKQPPYYLLTQLPGQDRRRLPADRAVTPNGRQNLAALISGVVRDGKPRWRCWSCPTNRDPRAGAGRSRQMQRDRTSPDSSTCSRGRTDRSMYGNLLSLPFGGGMLYVEPLYMQTSGEQRLPADAEGAGQLRRATSAYADNLPTGIRQLVERASDRRRPASQPATDQPAAERDAPSPPPHRPVGSPSVGCRRPPRRPPRSTEAIDAVRERAGLGRLRGVRPGAGPALDAGDEGFEAARARANPRRLRRRPHRPRAGSRLITARRRRGIAAGLAVLRIAGGVS